MTIITKENDKLIKEQFLKDVISGLNADEKYLSAKYFYDENGDAIFQQIMNMEEYYLTNAEMDIISNQTEAISNTISNLGNEFDLIELGAGDATKSIHLLKSLINMKFNFSYLPIDISSNVINSLEDKLPKVLPNLNIKGFNGDYFEMLSLANTYSTRRKVVLFMGANIGNMPIEDAQSFCKKLNEHLSKDDMLIIGFDLKKNPKRILAAYNDEKGITSSFNLNLLARINKELNGNFNLNNFEHYANYDPQSGSCKSYLISLIEQKVTINNQVISFLENEHIYMEISQKYSLSEIENLSEISGFDTFQNFTDLKGDFVDSIWTVK